jgi:DNA invertase Pin-like site-specific DNA recombinase
MHKWVYWKATGETPEVVKHLCDNPVCLNLAHLKGITVEEAKSLSLPQTNARSRVNNRPPVRWGKIPEYRSSIDKEKVQQIREAIAEGQPFRQIARTLEVSLETVLAISNNQAYRSLPMSSNVVEIEN